MSTTTIKIRSQLRFAVLFVVVVGFDSRHGPWGHSLKAGRDLSTSVFRVVAVRLVQIGNGAANTMTLGLRN